MSGAELAAHALAIAHGVGAALACAAAFYVGGVSVLPRRLGVFIVRGDTPVVIGAAVYVLVCWWGVGWGVPVARLAAGLGGATLLVAVIRFRRVGEALRGVAHPRTVQWLLVFVLFYVLAYVFTLPPVTGDFLPPAWLGNSDLLTYARYTRHALHLGPSNLAHADFSLLGFIYLQTPAVFYLLGLLSMCFGLDPLAATMPAAFSLTALTGVFAARISRSVFRAPRWIAIALGGALISGPFFRYIAGNYFLSTLMSVPVALFLVWDTARWWPSRRFDLAAATRLASAYVLLLLLYPLMLVVGVGTQLAVVVLMSVAQWRRDGVRHTGSSAFTRIAPSAATIVLPLALLGLVMFSRLAWSVDEMLFLSRRNVAGWALGLISPWAMLGVPAAWMNGERCAFCVDLEVVSASARWTAAALFMSIPAALTYLYLFRFRARTTPAQQALAVMAGASFAGYYVVFLLAGTSYQQWKLASYTALPWSFVVLAAVSQLARVAQPRTRAALPAEPRRLRSMMVAACVALVIGGNLLAHRLADPALEKLPAGLGHIADLNRMREFPEISVMMDETFNGLPSWLALYFLPDKQVHVISQRNSPAEPLAWESVSRLRPLLMQGVGCEGVGHDQTLDVPGVGCLLYAPPSLRPDTTYPFNRTYLFITPTGLGPREPEGRWGLAPTVDLSLMVDISQSSLVEDAFLNLRVSPYLPPGTAHQRVVLSWGVKGHGEVTIDRAGVISLPIQRADWSGLRMWTLPVSAAFPDRVAPPWMYAPKGLAGGPPLAALFEELSMTREPRGTVVVRTSEAGR